MRSRKLLVAMSLLVAFSAGCHAQVARTASAARADRSAILPLTRVRLYETGVAYFERSGHLTGGRDDTTLPVPASHLDDALKTMVVLSGGETTVSGVEFSSAVTQGVARALVGVSAKLDSPMSRFELLTALRGERVEVTSSAGKVFGRIVHVVKARTVPAMLVDTADDDGKVTKGKKIRRRESGKLVILTDKGAIMRLNLDDVDAVRPTDPATAQRMRLALDTLSPRAAQRPKSMRVMAHGGAPVTLGYVAEAPMWRTTYRVVLGTKGKSTFQGWALLHNDTDEAWNNVRVELVNGRPDSFLFPLAAPRYARRKLVTPDHNLSTLPQLLNKTPDGFWGDFADDEEAEGVELGAVGTIGYGSGSGHGYGSGGMGLGSVTRHGVPGASDLLEIGQLANVQTQAGVEAGVLFTYTLPSKVNLRAHGSVLAPFVSDQMDAQLITWFDDDDEDAGRSAAKLTNTTKQTLPSGPISFFFQGGFVGESYVNRMKPGESRFMSFGVDLDVQVTRKLKHSDEQSKKVTFGGGTVLYEHYVKTDKWVYHLKNRSPLSRDVARPLRIVSNASVKGVTRMDFDEESENPVAVFHLGPKEKKDVNVTVVQGLRRSHDLLHVKEKTLKTLMTVDNLTDEQRKVVQAAQVFRRRADKLDAERKQVAEQLSQLRRDLVQYRRDLKSIGGSKAGAAGNHPFVQRVLKAEDEEKKLREKAKSLSSSHKQQVKEMRLTMKKFRSTKQ